MGVFDIFRKAAPVRSPTAQPASPVGAWTAERRPAVSYAEAISAQEALKHPVVFRCLNKIASAAASVNWYVEQDMDVPASERANATTLKKLNALLQSPSDTWTRAQLIYWMALNYACYGKIPFKVGVGATDPNIPNGIYPLTARWVTERRDERGLVVGFRYGETDTREVYPTRQRAAKGQSYVYEIIRPNLDATSETTNNIHPLGAIGLPSDIIKMLMQRAADTAAGHPNTKYIVTCEKTLTNAQKKAVQEHIESSAVDGENSGRVLFLFNTKVEVHKLDNDLSDIHSKVPLDDMARMIVGAFGIPVALVGIASSDASKFAGNYAESRRSFWEDTMIPDYMEPIAIGLTAAICPYGARVRFDYDSIQAMADVRIANAEKLGRVTFLTRDEKREITRFEPLPAGMGGEQLDFPPGTKDTQQTSSTPPSQGDNQTQDTIQ